MVASIAKLEGYYDDDDQELLYWFSLLFGILSLLGQLMVICVYICLKLESPISARVEQDKARSIHVFIVSISIFDMMRIIGTLIDPKGYPYSDSTAECQSGSVLVAFGALSSYLLVGLISVIMVIAVFRQNDAEKIVNHIHRLRTIILCVITVVSLLASLIPVEYWCTHKYHANLRGVYFIPLLAIFGVVLMSYLLIFFYFCHTGNTNVANPFFRDLKLFPAILIVCWIFSVYRRIYNAVTDDEPLFAVSCVAVITNSLYGFCNFVAYFAVLGMQRKQLEESWSPRSRRKLPSMNGQNESEMQAISQKEESLSDRISDKDSDPLSVNVAVVSQHY